jgi:hypothetical protein
LIRSSPSLPISTSLPEAAVDRELDAVGLQRGGVDDVVAAEALRISRSLACSWKKMLTAAWSPKTLTPPASPWRRTRRRPWCR